MMLEAKPNKVESIFCNPDNKNSNNCCEFICTNMHVSPLQSNNNGKLVVHI